MNIYEQIILALVIFVIVPLVSIVISPKVGNVVESLSPEKTKNSNANVPTNTPLKSYTINHRGQVTKNN